MDDFQDPSGVSDVSSVFDKFYEIFEQHRLYCEQEKTIPLSSMLPCLLNKSISYPEKVYKEYTVFKEEDKSFFGNECKYDYLVFPPGLLGIEYIKSHVFYTPTNLNRSRLKFSSLVECLQGEVTVIMQKNSTSEFGPGGAPCVQEGIIIELKPEDKIGIPEGYYYTFVNTGEDISAISRIYKSYSIADYTTLRNGGLAYFCIRKNAKRELVYNPRFRQIPSIKSMKPEENHLPKLGLDLSYSLYDFARINTEMLEDILV
jgi:oxalate decarboxylase/phosphoglucose isomerase-like protein (cupin superfamily)